MSKEKYIQLIEEVKQSKFTEFDAVTFDKDSLCVTISRSDFHKLMSSNRQLSSI